jgi:hypothetical protein
MPSSSCQIRDRRDDSWEVPSRGRHFFSETHLLEHAPSFSGVRLVRSSPKFGLRQSSGQKSGQCSARGTGKGWGGNGRSTDIYGTRSSCKVEAFIITAAGDDLNVCPFVLPAETRRNPPKPTETRRLA